MKTRTINDNARTKDRPLLDHPIRRDPYREEQDNQNPFDDLADLSVAPIPVMQIASTVYMQLMSHLTTRPPEAGGVLVGPRDHDAVTHYLPDETGDGTPVSFTFDHIRLNQLLARLEAARLDAKGVVHSHPLGCPMPSRGDLSYVARCFALAEATTLPRFLLPIVCGQLIYPYIVTHDRPWVAQFSQIVLF